jgi:glycosyltransferase involved in cell wall biosynthesis
MVNAKIKVLLIIDALYGGGAERVFSNIVENLDQKAIEPVCLFYDTRHLFMPSARIKTYTLSPVDNSKRSKRIERIAEIIDLEHTNVIISFLKHVNVEVVIAREISRLKPKLILTEHTTPSLSPQTYQQTGNLKQSLPGYMYQVIEESNAIKYPNIPKSLTANDNLADMIKILYPRADKICAVSMGVRNDLVKNFAILKDQIKIIYNGIDIEQVIRLSKEEITEHRWFSDDIPIIINVASLRVQKGQEYLLKMFEMLHQTIDCRLAIFGIGERETELKELAHEMDIYDSVKFFGYHKNPFKFMERSKIFAFSSVCEGCPNTLLEAMACRTPIVSTDCSSGPNELIKDGFSGILVPEKDPTSIANACMRILNDKQLALRLTSNAAKELNKFSIDRMVSEYTQVIHEINN